MKEMGSALFARTQAEASLTEVAGLAVDAQARIPICRPQLPPFDRLAPYAAEVDSSRLYTNFGLMHERLRRRLAEHFDLSEGMVGLAGSGTMALIGLILATAGRATAERPLCVCPSFTFVATAVAAQACGYTPWLADIDARTLALEPAEVASLPMIGRVGVVLVVAPFGWMVELQPWQDFAAFTGIPVVVDAAACFDTLSPALIAGLQVPVAVSLHATKTFSSAEGGLMLCGDPGLVRRASAALNFGFDGERISTLPSTNGKMSEYHALVGLADLDGWTGKRAGFLRAAVEYRRLAELLGITAPILVDTDRAVPYAQVMAADADEAKRIISALDRDGIEWRRWYGTGLHPQPAFADCPRGSLETTNGIGSRLIGLPLFVDLAPREVERILRCVASALDAGPSTHWNDAGAGHTEAAVLQIPGRPTVGGSSP